MAGAKEFFSRTWRHLVEGAIRTRNDAWPIVQGAGAAGIAWFLAYTVLGHPQPFFAPITAVAALAVTGAAAPAEAQVTQEGLVNVSITDTNIQVPIGVAANVCGVTANVLASATQTDPVDCAATGTGDAYRQRGGDGGPTSQSGLVNINLDDTNVQLPIAVAANVCGIAVNVLANQTSTDPVDCDAQAWSRARNTR